MQDAVSDCIDWIHIEGMSRWHVAAALFALNKFPVHYTPDGLAFSEGTGLKADFIDFATGLEGNMRRVIQELFGDDIPSQVKDFWGVDEEGEIKGAWRHSGRKVLWCHGGTVGQARYFSRFSALQIKVVVLGTPLKVYRGGKRSATVKL